MPRPMDYAPGELSSFFAASKKALSSKALSTLRVMAFLDSRRIHNYLFEPLRPLFAAKNQELEFDFPTTAEACKEACTELLKASLLHSSKGDKTYAMRPEVQTSVLADAEKVGLISPLFNAMVTVLVALWPRMICVPDRTVDQNEFQAATAPGTTYEAYLKKRYLENRLSPLQEYEQYANFNVWGRRNELIDHVARLERIFFHFDDEIVDVCATVTFAMLLTESAWYYIERSRYYEAKIKIESALGVYELGQATSSLHHASIYRVHAVIALENGKSDDAARYVTMQLEQLQLHGAAQGDSLDKSGLLDWHPDAIGLSVWGRDVLPGLFVVLPFRSICSFGFKLYFSAQSYSKKDHRYTHSLNYAEACFTAALKDCQKAPTKTAGANIRLGELHYALGNVANKQANFLGRAQFYQSLEHFENALKYFQYAITDGSDPVPGIAKTHYKLVVQFINIQDFKSATHHLEAAMHIYANDHAYEPHLARALYQQSRIQALTGDPLNGRSTLYNSYAMRVAVLGGVGPNEKRVAEEMTEADFDELVDLWDR